MRAAEQERKLKTPCKMCEKLPIDCDCSERLSFVEINMAKVEACTHKDVEDGVCFDCFAAISADINQ